MSARRKKGHAEEHGDDHPDERWMASYMDMITVLMCLFIVLFAMSSVDANKFAALKESLATGFGQTKSETVDTASGTVVKAADATKEGEGYSASKTDAKTATAASGTDSTNSDAAGSGQAAAKAAAAVPQTKAQQKANTKAATAEVDDLTVIKKAIAAKLAQKGLSRDVEFAITSRGLTVRLVGSETFFGSNSADLSGTAKQVMDAIAPVLKTASHSVSVEGHADSRASTAPYATNWELSAARATAVLRDLVERGGMPGERIQSVGFGSSRPLAKGDSDADLAKNRRVDIVVLSNQKDEVNALIPKIAAAEAAATGAAPTASKTTESTTEEKTTSTEAEGGH
ncbi:flagellar motor protein MotB [Frondihabitans sp. VKM Ac-2883]|uniref:OmpA/MotB family protein n=1 Tax=Frondihabitans sp. VKM Ac-2883 TaxID=2783823 RepID=UPI00188BDC37|nr:flagellar motor protein MotB [Frondihabitans sp. VKM Ac-2883]MBF4574949.1 flagellar motor protein MotB [Frondihabitans sp. VKM Ac-2883]